MSNRLRTNPNVESSPTFDVVRPGIYRMRIREVLTEDDKGNPFVSDAGNTCWRAVLEYVDIVNLIRTDGKPVSNPGTLRDSGLVIAPDDKQGKLRGLYEAVGLPWASEVDSYDLVGKEVDVKVKIEDYQGETRNAISRYIAVV